LFPGVWSKAPGLEEGKEFAVNSKIKWNLKRVVKYLDQTYPQVGPDCPFFALQVVLFAAAALQNTNVGDLSEFTGCSKDFVVAVARNMRNNNLWVDGKYDCSQWYRNGEITDHYRFCEETQAAQGTLWFSPSEENDTVDPFSFARNATCHLLWESLICGMKKPCERG
jgi:hypothetical protein